VVTLSIPRSRNLLNPQSCFSRPNTASTSTGRSDRNINPLVNSKDHARFV
jgi:hypothetical protein